MVGPFTPGKKDVWYCDHKKCQYTQYGVYRRYKIQNWRSSQFGKKFTLCDGCVRQYKKEKPRQQSQGASNVNVKVNINGAIPMQQQQPMPAYGQPVQYMQPMVHGQMAPIQQQQSMINGQMVPIQQQSMIYGQQQQSMNNVYPQQYGQQQSFYAPQPVQQMGGTVQQQPAQYEQKMDTNDNQNDVNIKKGGDQIVKQGWMMKKGDMIKSWKKRYFVLKTNRTLNYYESDAAVMVKGVCHLNKVKSVKKKKGENFEVDTSKRTWCFACKDTKTRDDWVKKIKSVAAI